MAAMTFPLDVEMDDGTTFSVVADQRDIAKFEMQPFGFPFVVMETKASMSFFRYLAWSAGFRQGLTTLKWAEFDSRCVEAMPPDVDDEDGEGGVPDDAGDPGRPALSGTPTSRSRSRAGKR
jgi:hypothetical protein